MATITMLEQVPPPKPVGRGPHDLQGLTTETENAATEGLDTKSALEIARIINHEDAKIAAAVKKALPEIAIVIDTVARSLRDGGRLIYVGAGSSGRIASLDASECPPTYSTAPAQVQYIMAGGPKALASASDVNEDSPEIGQRDIARRRPTRKDIVIGVSASGRTPTSSVPSNTPALAAPKRPPSLATSTPRWPTSPIPPSSPKSVPRSSPAPPE